jgi:hypothetical protein
MCTFVVGREGRHTTTDGPMGGWIDFLFFYIYIIYIIYIYIYKKQIIYNGWKWIDVPFLLLEHRGRLPQRCHTHTHR